MMGTWGSLSPQVRAFLDEERADPELPAAVRARAVARARAALAAGMVAPPAASTRATLLWRWGVSVFLACAACAAALVATYSVLAYLRRGDALAAAPVAPVQLVASLKEPEVPAELASTGEDPSRTRPRVLPPPRSSPADALGAELRLLQGARAALGRGDFGGGLLLVAEHSRRFSEGRLAEEREALRIRALLGLGRVGDARRAAAAFRTRFAHSVLLPAVEQMSASARH